MENAEAGRLRFLPRKRVAEMSSKAREGDLKWTRQLASVHPDPSCPLLLVRDTFEGGRAAEPMIFNMHLVAEGPVETAPGRSRPARPSGM